MVRIYLTGTGIFCNMLAGDVNRLSISREYGFHSSTGTELSPLGSREQKLSPLDKKVQSLSIQVLELSAKG
jgi:hypothetical protein